ncbi:MAG: HD domain-containing protein [Actinomycetota bacterium]|nr:HD domain-containing protein [Actinomycetota bacterium]
METFYAMDVSTKEQWMEIGAQVSAGQVRVANSVLDMLRSLSDMVDGFAVDQLTHCLQTATRARLDDAPLELVIASLCHDVGKAISVPNHAQIASEILKPYVSPETYAVIRNHQDFQGKHYYHYFGGDPNMRENFRNESWFASAERFADDWDQKSFDPTFETMPLEAFEDELRFVFAKQRY